MKMMRCKGEIDIRIPRTGLHESFWPGVEVDFHRVLAPADGDKPTITVEMAVEGREDCFETIDEPAAVPMPAAPDEHADEPSKAQE